MKVSTWKRGATAFAIAAVGLSAICLAGSLNVVNSASASTSADDSAAAANADGTLDGTAAKTLEEWVAEYPLEGESFMQAKMSGTYDAFLKVCTSERFGLEGVPVACASCHAREDFRTVYAAYGNDVLDDYSADYDMEWSNCTNCHVGDPGDGVVKGGNAYGEAASASAEDYFDEDDNVCAQCHTMFPGATYLEEQNTGIDQYKYGYTPDEMLKAMEEYFEANPITETTIGAGLVGTPAYNAEIDTWLYLTDACTSEEMFLGGTHKAMGLTCTDCHMPQTTADDGTVYTNHNMTMSPLENPDALELCLSCHKAQGIEDEEAMVAFAEEKMADVSSKVTQAQADLATLYGLLAQAVADGNVDESVLDTAKDAYNRANIYILFQGATSSKTVRAEGRTAVHNYDYCVELLDSAETLITGAICSLEDALK